MYVRIRPWLFRLDAEQAHRLTLASLQLAGASPIGRSTLRRMYVEGLPAAPVDVFGLHFLNPLGLAAGYDKEGLATRGLACLGFSHVEVGTVTLQPQAGNPRPRIFRLPEDEALINRMGFPNPGMARIVKRLSRSRPEAILGVNIGKGKDTPLESASGDYVDLLRGFGRLADYVAVNVSSPNTLGLRSLQGRSHLEGLLAALGRAREELGRPVPILVKLSPDLNGGELDEALDVILAAGMDGVIAVNTTLDRQGLTSDRAGEGGGLSGRPLLRRALEVVAQVGRHTQGRLPLVAAGGIHDIASARAFRDAGASLLQVFTGLVYRGPALIREILEGLA
jgi:dihydroorotate dehydrogenase